MIQKYKPSRVHPCTMRFKGVLCNGTAILYQDTYTCTNAGGNGTNTANQP